MDKLPEEGFTPRLVDSYRAKGADIMVYHGEMTKNWFTYMVPTLLNGEGSRLKSAGRDALPTYRRAVAWFPGPTKDADQYLL